MRNLLRVLSGFLATVVSCAGFAQPYPNKPIRIVVPYSAGGAVDYVARTLAQALSVDLGQPVVVDNRPGASGNIGTQAVATARADGYTLLMSSVTSTSLTTLSQKSPPTFDYRKDFVPLAVVGEIPFVLIVHQGFAAQNVQELINAAKASASISYSSSGVGSAEHLGMVLFQQATDTQMIHIPYDGASTAIADVAGGHISAMVASVPTAIPQITGGNVRALMAASQTPLTALPDVPTATDAGLPNVNIASMYALLAAADVDADVVARLNAAITKVTRSAPYRTSMSARGIEPVTTDVAQARQRFDAEIRKWEVAIRGSRDSKQ